MPVQVTSLGPNSAQLYYTNTETLADIKAAIETFLTTHGWELHDAGFHVNAPVYKALNADGVSYKYVMMDYRTGGSIITSLYDVWDVVAHNSGGIPPSYGSDLVANCQRLTVGASGYINIFATARWLALYNRISDGSYGESTNNAATIIVEYARDIPEDTYANNPTIPVLFGTVATLLGHHAMVPGFYPGQACFSLPRTRMGTFGAEATIFNSVATICGRSMPELASPNTANAYLGLWQCLPNKVNPFNNKNYAFTMYAGTFTGSNHRGIMGRVFGLKAITFNAGLGMDTISIPSDGEYFYSRNGVATQHYVLPSKLGDRIAIPA